jgi:glycosyltransferase involved in cell wall biosynthesis
MVSGHSHPTISAGSSTQKAPSGSVDILLCTLNGARFLTSQLASFESQDFTGWRLFVADDGSEDDTLSLLTAFQKKYGHHKVSIRRGPAQGFVKNFLSLICDPTLDSDYYALSDQDDVWDAHKLSRARSFLMNAPADVPSLYCSRTRLIDEAGVKFGLSPLFRKPPYFRNALVQNVAGGNTMVFNEKTRRLLMKAGPDVDVPAHDWWIYLAVAAVGGRIFYDPFPTVAYRIHANNLIGSNRSLKNRIRSLWKGRFKISNDLSIRALERVQDLMPEENRRAFELFRRSRNLSLLPRVYGLLRCGIYRQNLPGNIGLFLAVLFRKI